MSLSSRLLRLSISVFLSILPGACIAQMNPQFLQPQVQSTGGHVTSFILGDFQLVQPSASPDILYVNAFVTPGTTYSVTAGLLLTTPNTLPTTLTENQIVFPNVLGVTPAVADFDGDGRPDFAFVLAPVTLGATNLCVYHGTGFNGSGNGSPSAPGGCSTFPTQPNPQFRPVFGYVVAALFKTQGTEQLFVEDTANNYIYVLSNKGKPLGFAETAADPHPRGRWLHGPIYTGDFNGDGNTDFILNNQTSHKVNLYLGNGDGTFQSPVDVHVNGNVYSMLLHDMNGDGIPDLVTELDNGVIEIQLGVGSNTPGALPRRLRRWNHNQSSTASPATEATSPQLRTSTTTRTSTSSPPRPSASVSYSEMAPCITSSRASTTPARADLSSQSPTSTETATPTSTSTRPKASPSSSAGPTAASRPRSPTPPASPHSTPPSPTSTATVSPT